MTPPTGLKLRRTKAPTPPLSVPSDNDVPSFSFPTSGGAKGAKDKPQVYDFEGVGTAGTADTTTSYKAVLLRGEQEPSEGILQKILEDGGEIEVIEEILTTTVIETTTILEEVAPDEADVAETVKDVIASLILGAISVESMCKLCLSIATNIAPSPLTRCFLSSFLFQGETFTTPSS